MACKTAPSWYIISWMISNMTDHQPAQQACMMPLEPTVLTLNKLWSLCFAQYYDVGAI